MIPLICSKKYFAHINSFAFMERLRRDKNILKTREEFWGGKLRKEMNEEPPLVV